MSLDMSFGSISAKHFMTEQRAKLQNRLSRFWEFRFYYNKESNFDRDETHTVIEMLFYPVRWLGLSVYGEPGFYKRQDDIGLALVFKPIKTHEIRIFNTFVDFARLRRNDRTDTYIEPHVPTSRGLVGRIWRETDTVEKKKSDKIYLDGQEKFFEYAARWDSKTRWSFPDQSKIYDYSRYFGSLFWVTPLNSNTQLQVRVQIDRRKELEEDYALGGIAGGSIRDRGFLITRIRKLNLGPNENWDLTFGAMAAYRKWDYFGESVKHTTILPHVWWGIKTWGTGAKQDRVVLGWDSSWHQGQGPASLRNSFDQSSVLDLRFNLLYEFNFSQTASFRLIASVDLDEIGTRHTWEGGAGQLKVSF